MSSEHVISNEYSRKQYMSLHAILKRGCYLLGVGTWGTSILTLFVKTEHARPDQPQSIKVIIMDVTKLQRNKASFFFANGSKQRLEETNPQDPLFQ